MGANYSLQLSGGFVEKNNPTIFVPNKQNSRDDVSGLLLYRQGDQVFIRLVSDTGIIHVDHGELELAVQKLYEGEE
jgi:hypothetical protein